MISSSARCNCGYVRVTEYVTLDQYFLGYPSDPSHPSYHKDFRVLPPYSSEFTPEILQNATELIKRVNSLFTDLELRTSKGFDLTLNSGWRPISYAAERGMSVRSHHCFGRAIDLQDIGNAKYDLLSTNLDFLEKRGFAMEHKSATKTWLHLQSVLPRSGKTVFYP